jgi:hypothetical protein
MLAVLGVIVALTASTAGATNPTCGSSTFGSICDMAGQLALTGGTLQVAAPASLTWAATMDGTDMHVVDAVAGDQTYSVTDATGSGLGWNITASATQFTDGSSHTLPVTALTTNGSTTVFNSTSAPTAACAQTGCVVPTASATPTYPVTVGTSAAKIYSAAAGTGMGSIALSHVGWWLEIAPNTIAGTYTSKITLAAVSAP